MKLVCSWLREFVEVPDDVESTAREIALRGFEVASVESGDQPVIDFEITANRPDCLSHLGLAREASAIWHLPLAMPATARLTVADGGATTGLTVDLQDADLCPRYCAQVFEVRIAPSPSWLQDRLRASGVRPINNVVDVTNYVMLEIGQAMHAFDLSRLAGATIAVRRARAGERLRTLDGVDRALDTDMLVIADAERPIAVGGVMGGADSEISAGTTTIALESAYFQPASVRHTGKRLGLKTEASARFERGADVAAPPLGLARAAALFEQIGAGLPRGEMIDAYPSPRAPRELTLRTARIARILGQPVPDADVPRILAPLGFGVTRSGSSADPGWTVTIPTFRVDVTREVDLIEEVGRHYGFDHLLVKFPALTASQPPPDPRIARDRLVRHVLTSAGFSESMSFAFIERDAALPFAEPGVAPAAIANPLSEKFAVLRPSLIAGLVDACAHNRRRGRKDVRLFEAGSRFTSAGEGRGVALALCGAADAAHWSTPERAVDFFDLKGVVELLLTAFGIAGEVVAADRPFLVRGRAAEMRAGDRVLGVLGQLQPSIGAARGLSESDEVYVAEVDVELLGAADVADRMRAVSLPRFPSIVRDVSVLVGEALPAASVRGTIRAAAPPTLTSIVEFDRYRGKGVPDGRVSLSLRLTFQAPDRTLTDEDAQEATDQIVAALVAQHGAERR